LALLDGREAVKRNDWDFAHRKFAGSRKAAMPCDYGTFLTNENWICKSEGPDTPGDLRDLRIAVGSRITWRRNQPVN
jgi:hypothetical protein